MMAATPRLSVSIPTHNNRAVLARCLASWERFAAGQSVEIVVVEDGCTDDTPEFLRGYCSKPHGSLQVRSVHEPNVHELVCTNRGFSETTAPLVLVWQDDMFLETPWLVPELIRTFAKHNDLGLLCLSRGLDCLACSEPLVSWEDLHDGRRVRGTIGRRFLNWFCLHEVDIVIRPWVVRRECINRVGALDEAFRPTEWDEADLCYRIRAAGWSVAVHAYERCQAYSHLGSATISKSFSDAYKTRVLENGRRFFERWNQQILTSAKRRRQARLRSLDFSAFSHTARRMTQSVFRRNG